MSAARPLTLAATQARLGLSETAVRRLIADGVLQHTGSTPLQVTLGSVEAFEARRERAAAQADAWSRSLNDLGAPLE